MKNVFWTILLTLFFATSCEEITPTIDCLSCETDDTMLEPQDRRVLVEEYTGVSCVNCPAANAELKNLQSSHSEQIILVGIHAGFFARPLSESQLDFRNEASEGLYDLFNIRDEYPSALINRKPFGMPAELQQNNSTQWPAIITAELDKDAIINVETSLSYDDPSRRLDVVVQLVPLENISEQVHLSIMITESGLVDAQADQTDVVLDYEHSHVLRSLLTAVAGDLVDAPFEMGEPISLNYSTSLAADWTASNCNVVAFAHFNGDPSYEVLQASEAHVAE